MPAEALNVALAVNGYRHEVEVPAHHTLLDALREQLGLTGTKECCAEGECGACTVLLDGHAVNSCLVLAVEADGGEVTTVEGLARHDRLSPVQEAFLETGGVQCGFCIPGMVVAAEYLLRHNPHPSQEEIREGLSGNLCRCGGYNQICAAVSAAAGKSVSPAAGAEEGEAGA
jgi:aerobic carbon-monoxide dehydrogenase small subunit